MNSMNPNSGIHKTTKGKAYINESGILIQTYEDNIELTYNDAHEDCDLYTEICKSGKRPVLVDIRNIKSVERKARVYYASDEMSKYVAAAALIISNPVSRVIGNFYMGLNKTVFPFRLFTNQEEAINWLKSFL
jgi:hypothetical protein